MSQFRNFINLLGNIGINSSEAMDLISKNEYFYHIAHYKKALSNNQYGGAKKKSIAYNNKKYVFYKTIDDDRIIYTLNSQNKGIHDCIIIYIDKHTNTAYIETIGNNKGCIIIGKIEHAGGSILMKISLKLIKKIKDKYNLEYVYLTDNAHKTFYDNEGKSHNIKLSNLLFFTKGYTYYEKFGFKPVNVKNDGKVKISKGLTKDYQKEKNILHEPIYELNIDYNDLMEDINLEYEPLCKNILKNKNDIKSKKISTTQFLTYYINKKEYMPIIDELLKHIIVKNKIILPKLWGIKL